MKLLLFLLITSLLAASPALSQTRKTGGSKAKRTVRAAKPVKRVVLTSASADEPPPPPPMPKPLTKERPSSDVFRDVAIGKWGVVRLSLPEDLTNEDESATPERGNNTAWISYARYWKQSAVYFPTALEVDLTVTTYDADFKKVVPDLKPELATPELLLLADLMAEEKNKNKVDSFVTESRPMEVGGVRGGFFLADPPPSPVFGDNRFMAGWYTYRYFEGKAQRIGLTITGKKDELPKALKIIESLELSVAESRLETF